MALPPLLSQKEYAENRVGFLGTIFASPWVVEDSVCLVGDAAHAFTPFFGQGCNSGFEDVFVFSQVLGEYQDKVCLFVSFFVCFFPFFFLPSFFFFLLLN